IGIGWRRGGLLPADQGGRADSKGKHQCSVSQVPYVHCDCLRANSRIEIPMRTNRNVLRRAVRITKALRQEGGPSPADDRILVPGKYCGSRVDAVFGGEGRYAIWLWNCEGSYPCERRCAPG